MREREETMKGFIKLFAIGAAALALAGCQTLASSEGYKFEQIGQRTPTTVSVRLVRADETYVSGTRLYAVHWTHEGPKATPKQQLLPLEPDAQGNFVYRGTNIDAGDTLRLAARIGPDGSPIYGSVEVH
jgi:hypothetical protein